MNRALFTIATLVPAAALAQPIGQGGAGPTGDVSLDLDPGSRPAPTPRPAPVERPAPAAQPNIIVVGPDGKITSTAPAPAENGYFVSGGNPAPGVGMDAPAEIHTGALPDLHVVRSGDTLWDISFYYFNDPWQWPKVWSYNPQITNPHWIYPGDLVRLLPRGVFVNAPEAGPEATPDTGNRDAVPAPAKKFEVALKQTAFVEKKQLDDSVTIDGAVDEKGLLGDGDSVYLSYPAGKPPKVGQRYSIYVPGTKAKQGDKVFGSYVTILGTLEVVSVKQDKRARGVIVSANQEIERGAKVGPLVKAYKTVPPVQPKVDLQGTIVGLLTRDQLIGDGEVVFLSLGKQTGVVVGNRMTVVRRGDAMPEKMSNEVGSDDRRFPARALGEIVVVEVGDKISVGLVTLSVQEMSVGDIVMMQVPK
ncbi:MAG: LysM peptidoglycan-binding domain-containing protein [Deltaproteobacteria bacterium]|nr:LysM peptidoglycan-binding domain-containing protein [Deltaproteobacteria bacterium]